MVTRDYVERETLYLGHRTRVVRATDRDGRAVILKQLRAQWPTPAELARLEREHDLLASLRGSGSLRSLGFDATGVPQLVTSDPGAVSLGQHLERARDSARTALEIALNLAISLAAVHECGVLHRDINPGNCIVHPDSRAVWLIDFDLASPVPHRRARPQPIANLEGTPAYFAPEQTGRMNRAVDARSDLYALGITLYELFSGHPPFYATDVLGFAHAHLALEPPRLVPVVPDLPAMVVDLVHTLIRKRPEDRYQSAAGVVADLRSALGALDGGTPTLTGRSITDRLELPQELYGRADDVERLNRGLRGIGGGEVRVVLISGEAGIGKTSLVHELYAPATISGARLVEGKFDQFSRDVPFTALSQVLSGFVTDVLSAPTHDVERWRERILAAAAPNAALLVELAPTLEILLGPQPAVDELAPTESQRRLHETLRRTLGAIATVDSPLVLFLDDLQWADLPSLRVLESLFRDPALGHLMLIGAWRSEEVGAEHALRPTIQAVEGTGIAVDRIELGPLERADVRLLFSHGLGQPVDEVAPLADAIYAQTGGNPFFLGRMSEQASATGAIRFDLRALRWTWDLPAIEALGIADNVVSFLGTQLEALSGDARTCLAAAALLGDAFAIDALRLATGLPGERLRPAIEAAVASRFIQPLDDDWWAADRSDTPNFRFAFVHDRIQQAARALSTDAERAELHLALARGLAVSPATATTPFQAAEHFCAVLDRVREPAERTAAQKILSRAGTRALQCAAHDPAHRFLEASIELAGPDLWTEDPDSARRLWGRAARAAWLVGRPDRLDAHVQTLRERARDVVDRLRAEEILVQATIARGDLHQALDAALAVLATAGVELPRKPGPEDVGAAIGATMGAVGDKDVDAITAKILDGDPTEQAVRRLLVRIASAAYVAEPNLLPLIACNLVQRTIASGASRESSYGFGVYSLCLCAGWLLEPGIVQGRTALALLERFPDRALDGPVRHVVHHFARVWSDPLRSVYDDNPDVYRSLMDAGDLEYAGWVLHFRIVYGLYSGVPLDELADEVRHAVQVMRLHDVQPALHCTLQFQQLIRCLRGQADDPSRLVGPDYDEDVAFEQLMAADFRAAALALSVTRLTVRLYFGDVPGAAAAAEEAMGLQDGAVALFYQVAMRAYGTLALFDASEDDLETLERVELWRQPVAVAAARNPKCCAHLLALMDAEIAKAEGDVAEAIVQYDRAIVGAGRAGFVHDEALANERAARMHLGLGSERIAQAYLLDARHCWQRWGATAKVDQLDRTYGDLLSPAIRREPAPRQASIASTQESLSQHDLDFDSVLKASQAIAQETRLDALLARSMEVLLENVGARRGVLLLVRRGELAIEAIGTVGETTHRVVSLPFEDGATVPPSIVRRVWRGGVPEVHDDASTALGAAADPYLQRSRGLSVLCAPVTHQGRPLGVLYFENNLAGGAFSPARVKVLEVLAPQLAVTLRNVRLHEAQNRFVPYQFIRSLEREDIVDVEVGDHKIKEVSVFFSDIWGFTPLVEHLQARDALAFINRYLSFAEPAITGSGGFIDTYLGDGIMALFDEPERNAQQAVAAAIAFHRSLDRFNVERRRSGLREVRTGVGINTGTVTMGTMGGQHSVKCGVVGDAVNLASRVEGLTRRTGSRLLLSDQTVERLTDRGAFQLRRAGRVRVRGRTAPLTVYEVLDAELREIQSSRSETLERFEASLDAYYAGAMEQAVEGFRWCAERAPGDRQAARFLELSSAQLEAGVPDDWDGIETLDRK